MTYPVAQSVKPEEFDFRWTERIDVCMKDWVEYVHVYSVDHRTTDVPCEEFPQYLSRLSQEIKAQLLGSILAEIKMLKLSGIIAGTQHEQKAKRDLLNLLYETVDPSYPLDVTLDNR